MKRIILIALVLSVSGFIHAQEAGGQAAASPPPLPPKPWLKRAPVPSQWVVSYSGKSKESAQPKASPSQTPADLTARKTVAVNKAANLIGEVTTRQSGAVVSRWKASGLFLTQVGSGGSWYASNGPQNGFNETDYTNCDFPGFDWISEKNYAGVKKIGSAQCLVFHDKVVTMDPKDLAAVRSEIQQAINNWEVKQEERKANPSSSATVDDPRPRPFNIDDYKMDAVAVIDSATGMPVMLSYMTDTGNETRTYQFYPAPATPASLPPGAQAIVTAQQDRLKRLSRPAAIP